MQFCWKCEEQQQELTTIAGEHREQETALEEDAHAQVESQVSVLIYPLFSSLLFSSLLCGLALKNQSLNIALKILCHFTQELQISAKQKPRIIY